MLGIGFVPAYRIDAPTSGAAWATDARPNPRSRQDVTVLHWCAQWHGDAVRAVVRAAM